MKSEGVKPKKDFWSFASLDGGEQFYFFYFFDGEDPKVHFYCSYLDDEDGNMYAGIENTGQNFSEFVNENIDYRLKEGY